MEILTAVLIVHLWSGVVSIHPDTGWPAGMAVIRTQAEYDRFVSCLPRKRLQQRQPAPPSDDPLLKKPAIDFSKRMLIVVTTRSTLTTVKIVAVERGSQGVFVKVRRHTSSHAQEAARPLFFGAYAAAEVERIEGEVHVSETSD